MVLSSFCHFQAHLWLSNILSGAARVFSGALENTCSYRAVLKMLQYVTYRIVLHWSSWVGSLGRLLGNFGGSWYLLPRAAENIDTSWCNHCTALQETWNSVHRSSSQYFISTRHCLYDTPSCYNHKKIRYTIIWHVLSTYVNLYIYIQSI